MVRVTGKQWFNVTQASALGRPGSEAASVESARLGHKGGGKVAGTVEGYWPRCVVEPLGRDPPCRLTKVLLVLVAETSPLCLQHRLRQSRSGRVRISLKHACLVRRRKLSSRLEARKRDETRHARYTGPRDTGRRSAALPALPLIEQNLEFRPVTKACAHASGSELPRAHREELLAARPRPT